MPRRPHRPFEGQEPYRGKDKDDHQNKPEKDEGTSARGEHYVNEGIFTTLYEEIQHHKALINQHLQRQQELVQSYIQDNSIHARAKEALQALLASQQYQQATEWTFLDLYPLGAERAAILHWYLGTSSFTKAWLDLQLQKQPALNEASNNNNNETAIIQHADTDLQDLIGELLYNDSDDNTTEPAIKRFKGEDQ